MVTLFSSSKQPFTHFGAPSGSKWGSKRVIILIITIERPQFAQESEKLDGEINFRSLAVVDPFLGILGGQKEGQK